MRYPHGDELPPEQDRANRKAIKLAWISIAYWLSVITLLYFVMGSSQALKAAWIEDILALFPPVAFLVASRFRHRAPNARFPYGYHRAISIAYLVATVALFALGFYILIESIDKLISGVHPPIGMVELIDTQVWSGWVMIAVLLYGLFPPLILGRIKQKLAAQLHDKVLNAEGRMNRADWLTALAAIAGIIGIGLGLWWADAVAAIVISLDIVHDGVRYMREAVSDLMDERPQTHDESEPHPLIGQIHQELASVAWIERAAVRLREHGHLISGDVWLVPSGSEEGLTERLERLGERLNRLDWRLHDIALAPVTSLEDVPDGVLVRKGG